MCSSRHARSSSLPGPEICTCCSQSQQTRPSRCPAPKICPTSNLGQDANLSLWSRCNKEVHGCEHALSTTSFGAAHQILVYFGVDMPELQSCKLFIFNLISVKYLPPRGDRVPWLPERVQLTIIQPLIVRLVPQKHSHVPAEFFIMFAQVSFKSLEFVRTKRIP